MKRDTALSITGVSKHQYYYRPKGGKRGKSPSTETPRLVDGHNIERVSNDEVIGYIKKIQQDPDTDYGYHKITFALMLLGFIINHKKVYRLMAAFLLLKEKWQKPARVFVKFRKVLPFNPLQVLEMDIKCVWVEQHRRHAFILTVIDTFTRVALGWTVAFQMKQEMVKQLWSRIIEAHLQPRDCINKQVNIEVRNDNDSRFVAKSVQQFFHENHLGQVFTHPYTPQENGHIESFHAILSEKLERYKFWSLPDVQQCLTLFYDKYNNQRLHSATLYLPPMVFWECWDKGFVKLNVDERKRKIKFSLLVPYQELSGEMSPRGPLLQPRPLDGVEVDNNDTTLKEMPGAGTFHQLSVENRPRLAFAIANVNEI
jgi:transposase InsO family protein